MRAQSNENRESFLEDYLALMADLNSQQNSLLWWATDISSKNRFNTPIPGLLQNQLNGVTAKREFFGLKAALEYILRWVGHLLMTMYRVILIKVILGKHIKSHLKKTEIDYVVKSFVYPRSFAREGKYQDVYFGALPDHLKAKGSVLILVDIPTAFHYSLKKLREVRDVSVVPWEYFLSVFDVVNYTFRGVFYKPRSVNHLVLGQTNVTDSLKHLWRYGMAKIQPYQLFHYPAFVRLCREIKVKRFISTGESNPWEKMCILAIRRFSPLTRIISYQHNVVPQASANMFVHARENGITPLPDKIITTGGEPKRILEIYSKYRPGMLETGCALCVELGGKDFALRNRIKNVLVALEGVDAAHAMAKYAIDQLKEMINYNVVFRTHPVLPWSYFQNKYGHNLAPYKHFRLSKGDPLTKDIMSADVVLYWGSTVGVESLSFGRPVVHFDNRSLLSFDPLFRCSYLKWTATVEIRLKDIFESIDALSENDFHTARAQAVDYLKEYFYPVSKECLEKFAR